MFFLYVHQHHPQNASLISAAAAAATVSFQAGPASTIVPRLTVVYGKAACYTQRDRQEAVSNGMVWLLYQLLFLPAVGLCRTIATKGKNQTEAAEQEIKVLFLTICLMLIITVYVHSVWLLLLVFLPRCQTSVNCRPETKVEPGYFRRSR